MSKYPATNIVYSGLEDKGGPTVTILDEKKNKWTIWKKDYDFPDQDSEAYSSLKNFQIGESFGVEYGEKEESFTPNDGPNRGKPIKFTRRTIYKILPTVANPTAVLSKASPQQKESNLGHSVASQGASGDAFGRRLGVQGHINALLSNPNYYGATSTATIADVVKEAIAIEDEAEKQLNPSALRQVVQKHAPSVVEELPTIQVEEGLSDEEVEGISF